MDAVLWLDLAPVQIFALMQSFGLIWYQCRLALMHCLQSFLCSTRVLGFFLTQQLLFSYLPPPPTLRPPPPSVTQGILSLGEVEQWICLLDVGVAAGPTVRGVGWGWVGGRSVQSTSLKRRYHCLACHSSNLAVTFSPRQWQVWGSPWGPTRWPSG